MYIHKPNIAMRAFKPRHFRPGHVSATQRHVPAHIARPPTPRDPVEACFPLDSPKIEALRSAGRLAGECLKHAGTFVRPGVTTDEIDGIVHDFLVARNAYPTPLGYRGFPKSACTSVNSIVLHGIPDDYKLMDGDVLKIDVSCFIGGVHGDNCATFVAGKADNEAKDLIGFTKDVLEQSIDLCGPGVPFRNIGKYIEEQCRANGYTVNDQFAGHGIGEDIHMLPFVMHIDQPEQTLKMRPGHCFTIEPAVSLGTSQCKVLKNKWSIVNVDGGLSAQEEHMVLITPTGREVLTRV